VKAHPLAAKAFFADGQKALDTAATLFPDSVHNGQGDAFRHAYWSTLMTRDEGETMAHAFANLHERINDNLVLEMTMDLHNNAVGRSIALTPEAGGQSLEMRIVGALNSGKLWWISNGQLVNTP
jgi:Domain of unknown function (DUF6973)